MSEKPKIGSSCMSKVVYKQFTVDPRLHVLLGGQTLNFRNRIFKSPLIENKCIVRFSKNLQNIRLHLFFQHDGDHFANAGFNPQRILGGQVIKVFKETSSNNVEVLETNIPLKPGDSGGPILNEEGSLIGLIMGKRISDPSKSYAIASNRIQQEYYKYRNSILN